MTGHPELSVGQVKTSGLATIREVSEFARYLQSRFTDHAGQLRPLGDESGRYVVMPMRI
jgi:hypothetical protein